MKRQSLILASAAAGVAGLYAIALRPRILSWGATPEDRARVMPGDAIISNPTLVSTSAITIDAPPEVIWPWLLQIGYKRGGLYSYDWLDRLFGFLDRPSSKLILPEFQHLSVGDKIYFGPEELTVAILEPYKTLALHYNARGIEWVWQFALYPLDSTHTRFVDRSTERIPNTVAGWLMMRATEPAAFIMNRRMLLGVKERAESMLAGPKLGAHTTITPTYS